MTQKILVLDSKNPVPLYAAVDDEDYPLLSRHNWHKSVGRGSLTCYASTSMGRSSTIRMHNLITGVFTLVDHKNGLGLDNRKENLRIATSSENNANHFKRLSHGDKSLTSKFKGVSYKKGRWQARVSHKHLGYFDIEEEAARAYDIEANKTYGNFARLNFPGEPLGTVEPRQKNKTSKYRGVSQRPSGNWAVQICLNQKREYLGSFETEEEAAMAYDTKARGLFGEFAKTNF